MASWNYRLVRHTDGIGGSDWFAVHQAHYDDDGELNSLSEKPAAVINESSDGVRQDLERMLDSANSLPVVDYETREELPFQNIRSAQYPAVIHKDPDSDYGVSFPDFPGCISAGVTLDEVKEMAAEALALHVEGMAEDGEAIPAPSSVEVAQANQENQGAMIVLIPLERS